MKYLGTKTVTAEPCNLFDAQEKLHRALSPIKGETEGYLVTYPDGYVSWCPKSVFEEVYHPTVGMTFGQAIEALKIGKKVTRRGWNGRGMYLWLKPQNVIKSEWCKDLELKSICDANGGEILALGTICMYTHDSTGRKAILTGWSASQSDMLLEDWEVLED